MPGDEDKSEKPTLSEKQKDLDRIYQYALQKSTTYTTLLISEAFGIFGILALFNPHELFTLRFYLLTFAYGLVGVAVAVTLFRIFHHLWMTSIMAEKLGFYEELLKIDNRASDEIVKSYSFFRPVRRFSDPYGKKPKATFIMSVVGLLAYVGLYVAVIC